jgi:hypothetical protein
MPEFSGTLLLTLAIFLYAGHTFLLRPYFCCLEIGYFKWYNELTLGASLWSPSLFLNYRYLLCLSLLLFGSIYSPWIILDDVYSSGIVVDSLLVNKLFYECGWTSLSSWISVCSNSCQVAFSTSWVHFLCSSKQV